MWNNSSGRCMSLHVETLGSGAPLVLLHGWGMHGGVWTDVARQLAEEFCVHVVDLPGHGLSGNGEGKRKKGNIAEPQLPFSLPPSPFTLDSVISELSAAFTEPLDVLGWSLGGQIALRWATDEPQKVQRLILVASTPCFTERDDWTYGMPRNILQQFAAELERDHAATLRRFLSLQIRGSEDERELLAKLRARLSGRGEPALVALRGGLDILRDADLRAVLAQIGQSTLVIAGERDKLTPPQASHYLAQAMPKARLVEISGAAHAPFLSHPGVFIEQVKNFLHE